MSAEGRIYFFDEDGKTTVIEAGREYKVLATNTLDEGSLASPAIAGKALFVRTRTHLYRIESKALERVEKAYGKLMPCCSKVPPTARWKSAIA